MEKNSCCLVKLPVSCVIFRPPSVLQKLFALFLLFNRMFAHFTFLSIRDYFVEAQRITVLSNTGMQQIAFLIIAFQLGRSMQFLFKLLGSSLTFLIILYCIEVTITVGHLC